MSHRILIEINSDCLDELRDEPHHFRQILDYIAAGEWRRLEAVTGHGLRFIAEKHHSEDRTVDWK